jgi:retron-type reverse transcriptase
MIKGTNKFTLETFKLPVVYDIYSFADYIGLSPSLIFVLSQDNNKIYYKEYKIPKRDGTKRTILEPCYSMKLIQRWILEEILYKISVSNYSFGFKKGMSNPLKSNAEMHKNSLFIFKMDLKNFFPSIQKNKIYFLYDQLGYNPTMSNMFTNICTINGGLPQGAVTSPYLSNLACARLDNRISKYCSKREIIYTRYADDFTFSSNDKTLLKSIYGMIKKIVEDEGFTVNLAKTHFLTPKGRKTVTGITLSNGEIKAPKEMKRKVRAMIHKAIITGDYESIEQIKGYIAYISSIESDYLKNVKQYINGFSEKSVCLFKESVDAYNTNKFLKDLEDFSLKAANDFVTPPEIEEYEEFQFNEREDYLEKHGFMTMQQNEDVCDIDHTAADELPF